jgi:hypothetical protein
MKHIRNIIHKYSSKMAESEWEPIPEIEIDRLQKTLYAHLRKMRIVSTKSTRTCTVRDLLERQNHTCARGKGARCWNLNADSEAKYLKLQWGCLRVPNDKTGTISDLSLLCAGCNPR